MPWDDAFATGHPEIDRQHRILFGLIDQVATDDEDDFGSGVQVVLDLITYVIQHFGYEEGLMARHAYPDAEAHLAAHGVLESTVGRLRESLAEGTVDHAGLRRFLDDWLQHHIGGNDKRLADFLAGRV